MGNFTVRVLPPVKSIPGFNPPIIINIIPTIIIIEEKIKNDFLFLERFITIPYIKSLRPAGTYSVINLDKILLAANFNIV